MAEPQKLFDVGCAPGTKINVSFTATTPNAEKHTMEFLGLTGDFVDEDDGKVRVRTKHGVTGVPKMRVNHWTEISAIETAPKSTLVSLK